MWDPRYKSVECCRCGKKYVCLPMADYYNSTTPHDGVCEACLLRDAGLDPKTTPVITMMPEDPPPFSAN